MTAAEYRKNPKTSAVRARRYRTKFHARYYQRVRIFAGDEVLGCPHKHRSRLTALVCFEDFEKWTPLEEAS